MPLSWYGLWLALITTPASARIDSVMKAKGKTYTGVNYEGAVHGFLRAQNDPRAENRNEAEEAAKNRREKLAESVEIVFYGLAGCIVGGLICWGTFEFIIYKMRL